MTVISDSDDSTITVVVPIEIRRRNGRPKIVLPDGGSHRPEIAGGRQSGAVVRAIARAWDWRRRLEAGEAATLQDIADAEKVTLPFVSRFIRLAYLAPSVLDRVLAQEECIAVPLDDFAMAALDPWLAQTERVFDPLGSRAAAKDANCVPGRRRVLSPLMR